MSRKRDEFDDPQFMEVVHGIFDVIDDKTSIKKKGRYISRFLILAVIVLFIAVIWYAYPKEKETQADLAIPVIRASSDPAKIQPDDPGGMDIPFQDSTLFDAMRQDGVNDKATRDITANKIENLLGNDEIALDRKQIFAGLKTEMKMDEAPQDEPTKEDPQKIEVIIPEPAITVPPVTETETEIAPAPSLETKVVAAPVSKPAEKPVSKPAPKDTTTAPAAGSHYIQMASLGSEDKANAEKSRIRKSYGDILGKTDWRVQKADLGNKGIYYRLQAGPMTQDSASKKCSQIKTQGGSCLVIKP